MTFGWVDLKAFKQASLQIIDVPISYPVCCSAD